MNTPEGLLGSRQCMKQAMKAARVGRNIPPTNEDVDQNMFTRSVEKPALPHPKGHPLSVT